MDATDDLLCLGRNIRGHHVPGSHAGHGGVLDGPYHDETTADRIWRAQTSRNVDIAQHRLFVLSIPQPS